MTIRAAWILRAVYVVFGLWAAAIGPFVPVILAGRGFDSTAIGLLTAGAALALVIALPLWGHLADILAGRARTFRIALVLSAVAALAMILTLPIAIFVIGLASFALFLGVFTSLTDALAVEALPAPERQYGALRALTSLSFAIGVIVAGFVYNWAGYGAAAFVALTWSAVLFLLVGSVVDRTRDPGARRREPVDGPTARARLGSGGQAFAVQPRLLGILAAFTLGYAGLQAGVTFVSIRIVELGGHPSDVALTFGISAFAEIPGLLLAGWLARRIGLRALTAVSFIGFGLCVAAWAVLDSPDAINVTRLGTGLCFGAFTASRVLLVGRLLPPNLQATGQGLLQAATVGLGAILGSALGGIGYGWLGPAGLFLCAAAAAIGGGIWAALVLSGPVGDRAMPVIAAAPAVPEVERP